MRTVDREEMKMLYPVASLEADQLKAVRDLESEIGSTVVALSSVDADTANLPDDKLRKLQALEEELDVVLVAVRPS